MTSPTRKLDLASISKANIDIEFYTIERVPKRETITFKCLKTIAYLVILFIVLSSDCYYEKICIVYYIFKSYVKTFPVLT